jgi:uncharacterized phage infection (PIP) family protein YhgE
MSTGGPYRGGPGTGPPGTYGQTGQFDPDSHPATAGDLKGLKRWIVVTAIWAVAASAIALIALFGISPAQDQGKDVDATQVADLARQVSDLETKVDKAASQASDAAGTASGLSSSVDDASAAAEDAQSSADKTASQLSDLQSKVDELDQRLSIIEDEGQPPFHGDEGQDGDGF